MPERNYYVICDDNCKFEGMTKPQIIEAISSEFEGVTPTHESLSALTVKEKNHKKIISLWIGKQSQYDAIEEKSENTLYIISEHNQAKNNALETLEDIDEGIETVDNGIISADSDISQIHVNVTGIINRTAQANAKVEVDNGKNAVIRGKITNNSSKISEASVAVTGYATKAKTRAHLWDGVQQILQHETSVETEESWSDYKFILLVLFCDGLHNYLHVPVNNLDDEAVLKVWYSGFTNEERTGVYSYALTIKLNVTETNKITLSQPDSSKVINLLSIEGISEK